MNKEEPKKPFPNIDVAKLTDFEVWLFVIERDVSQYKVERIDELLNKVGQARGFAEAEKKETAAEPKVTISEGPFNALKYEDAKSERLAEYQVAFKDSNIPDNWQHCYNVLQKNSATIKNHFTEPSWQHYYWLYLEKYDDRFYRKAKSS